LEVIHEEIMQIGTSRTSEELWRLWEDQERRFKRSHETLQEGGILFPRSEASYLEENT